MKSSPCSIARSSLPQLLLLFKRNSSITGLLSLSYYLFIANHRAGYSDIPGVLPPARLPIRHSQGRGSAVHPSVTHRAAGSCHGMRCRLCRCAASSQSSVLSLNGQRFGQPTNFTTAGARVWPTSPWSSFLPGRCRRHTHSDTSIPSGRSVSRAIDDS